MNRASLLQWPERTASPSVRVSWFQLSSQDRQQAKTPYGPLNPQVLNRYSYVLNNPLRYTDPTGNTLYLTQSEAEALAAGLDYISGELGKIVGVATFDSFDTILGSGLSYTLGKMASTIASKILSKIVGLLASGFMRLFAWINAIAFPIAVILSNEASQLHELAMWIRVENKTAEGIILSGECGFPLCTLTVLDRSTGNGVELTTGSWWLRGMINSDPLLKPGYACTIQGTTPNLGDEQHHLYFDRDRASSGGHGGCY